MRYFLITAIAVCMVAAIASSASAWFWIDDGHVAPPEGDANDTIFTWWIVVQLDGEEEPPAVWLGLYDGGHIMVCGYILMQVTELPDNKCYYWFQSWLYYTPRGWGFMFYVSPDNWTTGQLGPIVWP